MAEKRKPKWGYRSLYLFGKSDEEIFSPEFVNDLAQRYGMAERRSELKKHLEHSAYIYRVHKVNYDEAPQPSEIRAALREIEKLTSGLGRRLQQLDEFSFRALWAPERRIEQEACCGDSQTSEFGHTFNRIPINDKDTAIFYLRRQEIEQAINILHRYSEVALASYPKGSAGNPPNQAVNIWVANMESWWKGVLSRPFTLDYHKGEGLTSAFYFCWDALRPVDQGVIQAELITAMRYAIRRSKRRTGKNPP